MAANTPPTLNFSNTPGFQIYVNADSTVRTIVAPVVASCFIRSFTAIKTRVSPEPQSDFPDKSTQ